MLGGMSDLFDLVKIVYKSHSYRAPGKNRVVNC